MSIKASAFHVVSDEIANERVAQGEAGHRTACGRAYYSAYLAYRAAIRIQEEDSTYDFNHAALKQVVGKTTLDPLPPRMVVYIKSLESWRTDSDYEIESMTIGSGDAKNRVLEAKTVLELLKLHVDAGKKLPVPTRKVKYTY